MTLLDQYHTNWENNGLVGENDCFVFYTSDIEGSTWHFHYMAAGLYESLAEATAAYNDYHLGGDWFTASLATVVTNKGSHDLRYIAKYRQFAAVDRRYVIFFVYSLDSICWDDVI